MLFLLLQKRFLRITADWWTSVLGLLLLWRRLLLRPSWGTPVLGLLLLQRRFFHKAVCLTSMLGLLLQRLWHLLQVGFPAVAAAAAGATVGGRKTAGGR